MTAGSNTYCYDQNGNMSRHKVDANTYTLSYDAENRLTGVSGAAVASYVYDGDGQRVKATFGSGDSAGITSYVGRQVEISPAYREDFSDGLAQGWTAASGTWTVIGGGYRQSGAGSNTNTYRSQTQNQLLVYQWRATFTSGTSAGPYLFASTALGTHRGNSYRVWQDATHVRIYESANNVATLRASFAAVNAAGQTHSYQASYDPLTGKLQVWRDNLFLGSWTDATPLLSGSHLALRTDAANVLFDDLVVSEMVKYYESGGQQVALRKTGVVSYLFGDHLGSTSVTASAAGTRTGELWYKPWGESRGTPFGTTPTTYRYTGQREDASVGLYFYGARYYDSYLNRWIQPDTIIPNPGDPQSLNRYSYAANNPVKYRDPSGHIPCYGDGPDECSWAGYKDQPAGARRHSLRGYARFLEKQVQKDGMTALDAMTDLWGFAGLYGKDAVTTSEDVSYTLVGSGGTMTLLGGFILKGQEFLGGAPLNLPNFGDTGFHLNYQDRHNQPYHFWANVNTTAQGGNLGKGIGLIANVVHEMADPSEALKPPQERGTSWEDYFLSLKGMEMGQMLHSGALTVDQAGSWMQANLSAPAGPAYDFWKSTGTGWWPSVWMQQAVDLFR